MANLPGELATEEKLFFIMFKELIESINWNYFYIESNTGNRLYFGADCTIDGLMATGHIYVEYVGWFKDACITVLGIKNSIKR